MSPLPPSRTRRIAKWTGLVVCVVILAVWAVSTQFAVVRNGQYVSLIIVAGGLTINTGNILPGPVGWFTGQPMGFDAGFYLPNAGSFGQGVSVSIPFWLLFTLAAIPTALLWHRDRRTVKPGCCLTCGYDLRASKKICPECGTGIT